MKKRLCITAISLAVILPVVPIFSSGCSCLQQACQPYGPRVASDGTGAAIAVYEDIKSGNQHEFYAQKISPGGEPLWGEKGVLIGSVYKECDSYFNHYIVEDTTGGAFVVWSGYPSEPDWKQPPGRRVAEYFTHVTRVDSNGDVVWQREVMDVDHMISDGTGGVLIASDESYEEGTLSVTRLDSDGNFPWGEEGVSIRCVGYSSHTLGLASDGKEGAIILWQERKGDPSERVSQILAQKIGAEGSLVWKQEGIPLYTTPEGVYSEEPKVISDGFGGAIAVWMQVPEGKVESGTPKALTMDLYVQRVDADGNIIWQPNGLPLEISKAAEGAVPHTPLLVTDGSGGAIVAWEDLRNGLASIYAQRIDADGHFRWQLGGEKVCYIETNQSFWPRLAVSDSQGGAIITYGNCAQKIDADGRTMWPSGGIMFAGGDTHDLACDGHDGAIIAWGSGKSMFSSEKSYVQRVSAEGKLLWGEKSIRLNP